MAIAPLFQQQLEAAEQRGLQQGIQQGREEGQRSILESFFLVRFGELDGHGTESLLENGKFCLCRAPTAAYFIPTRTAIVSPAFIGRPRKAGSNFVTAVSQGLDTEILYR